MKFHMSSLVLAMYADGYKSCTHKAYHYQADVSIWTFIQDSIPRKNLCQRVNSEVAFLYSQQNVAFLSCTLTST